MALIGIKPGASASTDGLLIVKTCVCCCSALLLGRLSTQASATSAVATGCSSSHATCMKKDYKSVNLLQAPQLYTTGDTRHLLHKSRLTVHTVGDANGVAHTSSCDGSMRRSACGLAERSRG